MAGKVMFIAGIAVGYVLGTRRGRAGYVQLREKTRDLMQTDVAQRTAADVSKFARDSVPVVGRPISKLVDRATAKAESPVKDVPGDA